MPDLGLASSESRFRPLWVTYRKAASLSLLVQPITAPGAGSVEGPTPSCISTTPRPQILLLISSSIVHRRSASLACCLSFWSLTMTG
ncbi:hypothetical protein CC79DRAFT_1328127 [Sarocladium strictum]